MNENTDRKKDQTSGLEAILPIEPDQLTAFIPPLSDYVDPSPGWAETEFRTLELDCDKATVGYWRGEPGFVSFESWPYTEICSIISGQVALLDSAGQRRTFGPGDGFIVPEGWKGTWETVEESQKVFVAIYGNRSV